VPYLPLLLPFGLLMVVGGINVSESARAAGDDFRTRDILLVEAARRWSRACAAAWRRPRPTSGSRLQGDGRAPRLRAGDGLFIGIGGMLGVLGAIIEALPLAILAPILVYVAIGITMQAFEATPRRYAAAVVFSFFPAIARLLAIKLGDPTLIAPDRYRRALRRREPGTLRALHHRGARQRLHPHLDDLGRVPGRGDRHAAVDVPARAGARRCDDRVRPHPLRASGRLAISALAAVRRERRAAFQWSAGYLALAALIPLLCSRPQARAAVR
jgi:hypothetical protein